MPVLTPGEHHGNFLTQARKLGIQTETLDGEERSAGEIVKKMVDMDVERIRDLDWVGLPCSQRGYLKPSMEAVRKGD